jgi:hypothetical protein
MCAFNFPPDYVWTCATHLQSPSKNCYAIAPNLVMSCKFEERSSSPWKCLKFNVISISETESKVQSQNLTPTATKKVVPLMNNTKSFNCIVNICYRISIDWNPFSPMEHFSELANVKLLIQNIYKGLLAHKLN